MSSVLHTCTARHRDIARHDSEERMVSRRGASARPSTNALSHRSASASSQHLSARSTSVHRDTNRYHVKSATWTSSTVAGENEDMSHRGLAEETSATSSLLAEEISAIDCVEFGSGSIGSVRLDFVKLPAVQPDAAASTNSQRYISPFTLRDPVRLVLRRGELIVASASTVDRVDDSNGLSKPIALFPYSEVTKVELRRDASLLLHRADGLEVGISMHSAPKLIAAYKIVVLRCRGVVPKNVADARCFLERALSLEADETPSSQQRRDDSSHRRSLAPHVTSVILPKPSQSRSSSVSAVREVLLPPPRTVPNRTAKTPISETLASFSTSCREESGPGARVISKNIGGSPSLDVKVQHNLESSPSLAAREDRRKQLRDQLLELKRRQSHHANKLDKPGGTDR